MPRPRRNTDENLANQLDQLVAKVGSVRRVALAFGMHPTTLQRSLDRRAFGKTTNKNIKLNWDEALLRLEQPLHGSAAAKTPKETLLLLRKLNTLLSGAIAELEAAIEPQ